MTKKSKRVYDLKVPINFKVFPIHSENQKNNIWNANDQFSNIACMLELQAKQELLTGLIRLHEDLFNFDITPLRKKSEKDIW